MSEMHSDLALSFLRVAIDTARPAPAKHRHRFALFFESGKKPRLMLRQNLEAWLRSAGLDEQATEARRYRLRPWEILAWFTTDECSGLLALPVGRPGEPGPIALPTDDTIRSLIGETELCKEGNQDMNDPKKKDAIDLFDDRALGADDTAPQPTQTDEQSYFLLDHDRLDHDVFKPKGGA